MLSLLLRRGMARSFQIPQRFRLLAGNPHRRQISRPQKVSQPPRIPAIRLDPQLRLLRHQRRSHHDAIDPAAFNRRHKPNPVGPA